MSYRSPLRDLAHQLRHVARQHVCYSQVTDIINVLESHLNAMAICEEHSINSSGPILCHPDLKRIADA
jgi:hypothetical protein